MPALKIWGGGKPRVRAQIWTKRFVKNCILHELNKRGKVMLVKRVRGTGTFFEIGNITKCTYSRYSYFVLNMQMHKAFVHERVL